MNDALPYLFSCPGLQAVETPPELVIMTPLGEVVADATVLGIEISTLHTNAVFALPSGGHLFCWREERFALELLLCHPILNEYAQGQCDDCWAGLWRLTALTDGIAPDFTIAWGPNPRWRESGPNSGQGLMACEWHDETWEVGIGTEDDEWLKRRAERGDWLPNRWANRFFQPAGLSEVMPTSVGYFEHGFSTQFPEMTKGESCQAQFLVAWTDRKDNNTSFAVEAAPEQILAGAGCKDDSALPCL